MTKDEKKLIKRLLGRPLYLSEWENKFLTSLKGVPYALSEKQVAKMGEIWKRVVAGE